MKKTTKKMKQENESTNITSLVRFLIVTILILFFTTGCPNPNYYLKLNSNQESGRKISLTDYTNSAKVQHRVSTYYDRAWTNYAVFMTFTVKHKNKNTIVEFSPEKATIHHENQELNFIKMKQDTLKNGNMHVEVIYQVLNVNLDGLGYNPFTKETTYPQIRFEIDSMILVNSIPLIYGPINAKETKAWDKWQDIDSDTI